MSLRIQNNVEAFNAHRQLTATSSKAAKAMERLSSGYRVNRASDDAAGLAISEKMRSQIGGVAQAQRNAQDGVSLVQTAEGALTEVHSMLQRIRDLKVQSENDTLNSDDLGAIRKEIKALGEEIGDIQSDTKFNGISLLNGSGATATVSFQVGANTGEQITADTSTISGLSTIAGLTSATADATVDAITIDNVDTAIQAVSTRRADLGASQNRLEHRLNNLGAYQENLVASESRIRDVDMAQEMVNFSKLQILQQAGTAMLAQANQSPQGVLSLLR
jgi:flagellin